mmetsp:Transcript_1801/g.3870  ORF Transcript_1801/g.3870 Transcript_1801/m.3870 type:complete len:106 (+) Transcript_1801:35-352(+)
MRYSQITYLLCLFLHGFNIVNYNLHISRFIQLQCNADGKNLWFWRTNQTFASSLSALAVPSAILGAAKLEPRTEWIVVGLATKASAVSAVRARVFVRRTLAFMVI